MTGRAGQLSGATCAGLPPPVRSSLDWKRFTPFPVRYGTVFSKAGQAAGIDPRFLLALASRKSRFRRGR